MDPRLLKSKKNNQSSTISNKKSPEKFPANLNNTVPPASIKDNTELLNSATTLSTSISTTTTVPVTADNTILDNQTQSINIDVKLFNEMYTLMKCTL